MASSSESKLEGICYCVLAEFDDNPLSYWQIHQMSFPILSKVVQVYLGITSSVPVECMFSTAGLVANRKRASIGPEKLNRVLFIHDNFDFVTNLLLVMCM